MTRLLKHQLNKHFGKSFALESLDVPMQNLLQDVSNSYEEKDKERSLIEHVLEVNSQELYEVNRKIEEKNKNLQELNSSLEKRIKDATSNLESQNTQLRESIENFQNLLNATMEMIVLIDREKRIIVDINQSGVNMMGCINKNEIINTDFLRYVSETEAQKLLNAMEADVKEAYELTLLKCDGSHLYTLTSARNIISGGKILRMATMMDLTYIKEQEKLLLQQSRLAQMGEMIGMIAHQWRQPLAAISSVSATIQLKATLGKLEHAKAIELSCKISEYSQHLSATIDDFREFFKPNKEKRETTFHDIIQSVLSIVETPIQNHNIKIIKEFHGDDKFSTYPNELKQVVLNLLKNSEDILLEKQIRNPYIKIKLTKEKNILNLEVSDNGGGIPFEIIDNIFDPYFSTKKAKEGTGLGLYMSKTIIETHCKGSLSASNNSDGAVFSIKFKV